MKDNDVDAFLRLFREALPTVDAPPRTTTRFDNLHEMENKKLYSLDLMKVIAVLMITNSHFVPLYKDVNVALARAVSDMYAREYGQADLR